MSAGEKHVSKGCARSVDKHGTIIKVVFLVMLRFSNFRTTFGELFHRGNNLRRFLNEFNVVRPSRYARGEEFFPSCWIWLVFLRLFRPHVDKKLEVLSRDLFKVHPISPFHLPLHEISQDSKRHGTRPHGEFGNPLAKPQKGNENEGRASQRPSK